MKKSSIQSTINKFGKKMTELLNLVGDPTNNEWKNYVSTETIKLIEDLLEFENMSAVMEKNDTSYINLRAKYMIALDRIQNKRKDRIRNGKSEKARKLFLLIENNPNWKDFLTDREIKYTEKFMELKNFYAVGKELKVSPSNIAGALYGTNQRSGVIGKIEKHCISS